MEILLLHLAIDKIGVTFEWSAELCPNCSHAIPPLGRPAWEVYEMVLSGMILMAAVMEKRD